MTLNGDGFQRFVEAIYQNLYGPEFQSIKPHGRLGDGGNDGWIPSRGCYYQVYGPDDFNLKLEYSIKKMQSDFLKIMKNWNDVSKVKAFHMVINDKFNGCPAPLNAALYEISQQYKINAYFIGAEHLWKEFEKLDLDTKYRLLGGFLSILPNDILPIIKIIEDELELRIFPRMNENLISCGLHFSLVEKIPNLQAKLNYYTIPIEYAEFDECIKTLIYWSTRIVKHFTEYEYCELTHNSILSKTKKWKQRTLPSEVYDKFSKMDEEWSLTHQKLCNNFAYAFNAYLVLIRRIYNPSYLEAIFAFDVFYETPKYLMDV